MAFVVKVGDNAYVKRTSRFGHYHGRVVCTPHFEEARIWTREKDAERAAQAVLSHRCSYTSIYARRPLPSGQVRVIMTTPKREDG